MKKWVNSLPAVQVTVATLGRMLRDRSCKSHLTRQSWLSPSSAFPSSCPGQPGQLVLSQKDRQQDSPGPGWPSVKPTLLGDLSRAQSSVWSSPLGTLSPRKPALSTAHGLPLRQASEASGPCQRAFVFWVLGCLCCCLCWTVNSSPGWRLHPRCSYHGFLILAE